MYGAILGTSERSDPPSFDIDFIPRVTVSGDFDCGTVDRASIPMNRPKPSGSGATRFTGSHVLVLLVRKAAAWAVASERAAFMPDQKPICGIGSLSDPIVSKTLLAIQKLREQEYFAPPENLLTGKVATIQSETHPIAFRFKSSCMASVDGHAGMFTQVGKTFVITLLDSSVEIKGSVKGAQISGEIFAPRGKKTQFIATLR